MAQRLPFSPLIDGWAFQFSQSVNLVYGNGILFSGILTSSIILKLIIMHVIYLWVIMTCSSDRKWKICILFVCVLLEYVLTNVSSIW